MKKILPILLIALLLIAIIVVNFFVVRNLLEKQADRYYAKTTVVQTIDEENDTVVLKDANGNTWTFTGVEDWEVNNICSCLMDTMGTDSIYDDEIISTRYDGVILGWIIK